MKLKAILLVSAAAVFVPVSGANAHDWHKHRTQHLSTPTHLANSWTVQLSNNPSQRSTWGNWNSTQSGQTRYYNSQRQRTQRVQRQTSTRYIKPQQRKQKIWRATGIFAHLAPKNQQSSPVRQRSTVQFGTTTSRNNVINLQPRRVVRQPQVIAFAPEPDNNRAQAYIQQETQRRGIDPAYLPATVSYSTSQPKGTIIIDTSTKYLYLVLGDGKARRFGVGVGKAGFEWSGTEKITRKAEWPSWRPPAEMIAREREKGRELPTFMEGGPANPLGARALYLGSTLYRIHGTNQPWSIGQAVSSGCIRMRNEDVIELYERVGIGAKVIVS